MSVRTHIDVLDHFVCTATAEHFRERGYDWDPKTAEDCREAFLAEMQRTADLILFWEQPGNIGQLRFEPPGIKQRGTRTWIVQLAAAARVLQHGPYPDSARNITIGTRPHWGRTTLPELGTVLTSVIGPFIRPGELPDDADIDMGWV